MKVDEDAVEQSCNDVRYLYRFLLLYKLNHYHFGQKSLEGNTVNSYVGV